MAKTTDAADVITKDEPRVDPATFKNRPADKTVKQQLDAMDKVRYRIPLPPGVTKDEAAKMKKPPYVPVCVNGYTFQVRMGDEVMVPRVVADLLRDAGY